MRILEWNINQATNISGNNIIPNFIIDEVINQQPDIFIFTEFSKAKNWGIVTKQIKDNGYDFEMTNNGECKQNDILIAWTNNKFVVDKNSIVKPKAQNEIPECMMVPLNIIGMNKKILITGVRIKLFYTDYEKRKKQFNNLMELINTKLGDYKYSIIGGDFNNNKSDYEGHLWKDKWSIEVIDTICHGNNYIRKTPISAEGSSIYQKNNYILFQEDHFLVSKSIKVNEVHYLRDFTKNNPDIYLHGDDFQIYNFKCKTVTWSIPFGSGIPDHAMLIADFDLIEDKKK